MGIAISQNALKILIVTCVYPHHLSKHEGTFVANWAEQLRMVGLNVQVYKREHLTFGSYLRSLSRVWKFYRLPRLHTYYWQGIHVYRQSIHLRLPLNYSKSAPRLTYRKMKPVIEEINKKFPFNLVYLATWGDLSLAMSWIAKEIGIPYIASAIGDHTNLYYNKPDSIYFKYHREVFLGSEFVICVSNDLNNKVKIMTDGKANTITYYSGVDTMKFRPSQEMRTAFRNRLRYAEDDFVILFVGRLTKSKGVYDLIDAFARLFKYNRSLKLLLVGSIFNEANLRKFIRVCGVKKNVTLTGGVSHLEVPGYLNAADAFVLPSWMEGLPNVVMEASACERPVVASASGGIPEIIENNLTGFLVTPRSVSDLADRLGFVIANPELAANVAKRARQSILQKFNYHENGRVIFSKLQEVFRNRENVYQPSL